MQVMFFLVGLYIVLKLIFFFLLRYNYNSVKIPADILSSFPVDCMAIGGVLALLLFNSHAHLKYILNNSVFIFLF